MTAPSLVLLGALPWALGIVWSSARADIDAAGPAAADEVLVLGAASLALAITGWLVLATALEVLSCVPGRVGAIARTWSARLTPALARRVAAFVLGVGVGVAGGPTQALAGPRVASAAPATAASPASRGGADPRVADTRVADPGFAPSTSGLDAPSPGFRPADPAPPAPGFTPAAPRVRPQPDAGLLGGRVAAAAPSSEVVVHRGDSLWSIAARHLGPQASDAEIARAWPQWYELNRDVIGEDPDLILPGQVLSVPDAHETGSVTQ
ncbi:hypothetical protein ASG74_02140 [Knoellia sp. Soil729]|nr:hypothetical protein ASG74_02140 [Knoellia sp. Soil729]